jgi:hypothetical protein
VSIFAEREVSNDRAIKGCCPSLAPQIARLLSRFPALASDDSSDTQTLQSLLSVTTLPLAETFNRSLAATDFQGA